MWAHRFLLFFNILIPLFIISSSVDHRVGGINDDLDGGSGIAAATNKLVDSICKQTSNYTFCVESIYTDPRASKAHDYFLLAYISFGLAYLNATDTLSYIKHELEDYDISSSSSSLQLQRCKEDYEKAVSALEEAYNDLNSETYSDLKVLANSASHDALHCSSQQQQLHSSNFKDGELGKGERRRRRRGHSSSSSSIIMINSELRKRNADLRGLCEICAVVSNQSFSSN